MGGFGVGREEVEVGTALKEGKVSVVVVREKDDMGAAVKV